MTSYLQDWIERVHEQCESYVEKLASEAVFEERLATLLKAAGSPFQAVTIEMNPGEGRTLTSIGISGTGEESTKDTLLLDERTSAKIKAWSGGDQAASAGQGVAAIRELVETWWRADDRDGMTGQLQFSRAGVPQALASSLSEWSRDRLCAVVFGDVDRFKQLNDSLGQASGDEAIAKFAGFFADAAPRDGIVLRRGGDEFVLALPPRPLGHLVDELTSMRSDIENRIRDTYSDLEGEPLGFSMGVALVSSHDADAKDLDQRAERTMKPGGIKQRGRVTFESDWDSDSDFVFVEDAASASVEAARAQLGNDEPFGKVWLTWLSSVASSTPAGELTAERVAQAVAEVDPEWIQDVAGNVVKTSGDTPDGSRRLCALDVALALAHGATRAFAQQEGADPVMLWYGSNGGFARVCVGGKLLFEQGEEDGNLVEVRFPTMLGDPFKTDARRLVALRIGESSGLRHPHLYAEQIYVDDRPTRGGGLPDFWEAALAQVVDSLQKHPNVIGVVIDGDTDNGAETVKWMQGSWSEQELTYLSTKLNVSSQELSAIRSRLEGAVTLLAEGSRTELEIAESAHSDTTGLVETPRGGDSDIVPRLRRQLVARSFSLERQDGCRVDTASVAYPLALDVVRQTDADFYDSLGRRFSELIDFRIHLTEPTEDPIPRYYLSDKPSLSAYFDREFTSPGGKFFDALAIDDQYEHVIAHLCDCLGGDSYASRRAVLVLPHSPASSDVSPLGLTSVRAIPRLGADGAVTLDFSFTWRTVEAIVGLPYSLYGSIRFAEQITDRVLTEIAPSDKKGVEIGQLSYIAHSLHMYSDGYGADVARRIVNDESF